MTTPELIDALGDDAVRRAFAAVVEVLIKNGRVEIDGFGTFELVKRKPRIARNPRTGDRIDLPAKVAVKFKAARTLKRDAERLPDVPDGV
jgi:integration host factor subunit beta